MDSELSLLQETGSSATKISFIPNPCVPVVVLHATEAYPRFLGAEKSLFCTGPGLVWPAQTGICYGVCKVQYSSGYEAGYVCVSLIHSCEISGYIS